MSIAISRSGWARTTTASTGCLARASMHFRSEGGLSSNAVTGFFEDREGNLWVATSKGPRSLPRYARRHVFDGGRVGCRSRRFRAGRRTTAGCGSAIRAVSMSFDGDRVTSIRIPGQSVTSLWQDHAKRLWVGLDNELAVYEGGQFQKVKGLDGGTIGRRCDRDHRGSRAQHLGQRRRRTSAGCCGSATSLCRKSFPSSRFRLRASWPRIPAVESGWDS